LTRLIDESRHREAVVDVTHSAPTRKCPAAARDPLERARCSSMLIDLQSLADPDAPATGEEEVVEVAAPDPGLPRLWSEPEAEPEAATLMYVPIITENAIPPSAALAPSIATSVHRGRKRVASVRLLLYLGMLVFLCLGVLLFLGLGTWGVTDASISVSLGL
jgi:hypothetical protein